MRIGLRRQHGQRFGVGIEPPHRHLVPRSECREQPSFSQHLHRLLRPRVGLLVNDRFRLRAVGRLGRVAGLTIGRRLIAQRHAGTGIDEHGHPRWKDDLMFGRPLEIEIGSRDRRQRPQPQGCEHQAHAAGQFGRIAAVHPEHEQPDGRQRQHESGHLPPLRKPVNQPACDAVLHLLGGGEQTRRRRQRQQHGGSEWSHGGIGRGPVRRLVFGGTRDGSWPKTPPVVQ